MHNTFKIFGLIVFTGLLCACQTVRGSAPVNGASYFIKRVGADFSELGAVFTTPIRNLASLSDMTYMDKDGDLRLTFEEFLNAMTPSVAYRLDAAMMDLTVARYARADFYLADINKDGFVDRSELTLMRQIDSRKRRNAFLNYSPY